MQCWKYLIVLAVAACGLNAGVRGESSTATTKTADFKVFDNLFYPKKPDLKPMGFLDCNIVYAGHVWKGAEKSPDYGSMPDEEKYKQVVQAHTTREGPVVLDFETLRLSGKPELVDAHFKLFMMLVKWTHEAVPGHVVGFYGHGLFPEAPGKEYAKQAKELADAVDAFFPSMYTFNSDEQAWKKKAATLIHQARTIAPGKPIYFYIWPQLHTTPHAFLPADQWTFELNTSRELGSDGVVFWSSSSAPAWNEDWPWWKATTEFLGKK